MPPVLTRFGRYVTSPEIDRGEVASGALRSSIFGPVGGQHLWAHAVGGWVGKLTGTNATVRFAIYAVDGSLEPAQRMGYTASATASTAYSDITGGSAVVPNVSVVDDEDEQLAVMVWSGEHYAIAVLATGAAISHSMRQAAAISEDNENFYQRTGLSQPPPDPWGTVVAVGPGTQGQMSLWAVCDTNEAPREVVNRTPSGTIEETAPVFEGDFRDRNGRWGPGNDGADRGDRLNQVKIQVRRVSDGELFWSSTQSSTQEERDDDRFSKGYAGATLVRGTAYEWRTQVSDRFGEWGDWSDWLAFTPSALGLVTLQDDPTGKVEDNTPDFEGRWTHQSGTSMKTVQVRILNSSGGTVLQTGADFNIADVASSAAPGTLFTVPWANAGLSALAWGTSYRYQIRGFDGTTWSDWSASRSFSTDKAPTVPSSLAPANSLVFTDFPELSAAWSDADDTTGTGLTGTFEITRPNASTVSVTPTFSGGKWRFQTTATQLNAFGLYSFRARSFDGTLYSGGTTVAGSATWSAPAAFWFVDGPTVAIDAPTDGATIATSSFQVAWTAPDQVERRVVLYADGTTDAVFDTGWVVSDDDFNHTIPNGSYANGGAYDLAVGVKDNLAVEGWSPIVNLTVDYPPADALANVLVQAIAVAGEPFDSAIRVTWDATEYDVGEWLGYVVTRWAESGPDAALVAFERITSPNQTTFVDYRPASGHVYHYAVSQLVQEGSDELASDAVEGDPASVLLAGTVLTLVGNDETYRTVLAARERGFGRRVEEAVHQPLTRAAPTTIRSAVRVREATVEAVLVADARRSADEKAAELEAIDAQGGTVCYRDPRGRKLFATVASLSIDDELPDYYAAQLALRQEHFLEGA